MNQKVFLKRNLFLPLSIVILYYFLTTVVCSNDPLKSQSFQKFLVQEKTNSLQKTQRRKEQFQLNIKPFLLMLKSSLSKGLAVSGVSLAIAAAYKVSSDEGTRRSMTFWSNIFPIYLHYRFYQIQARELGIMRQEEADKKYEELHKIYSDKVKSVVYSMRGFYLKQAQLMSTQDDFVPAAYMQWVKKTQDQVPSEFKGNEAKEFCREMLKSELGLDFDDVFSSWDDNPIGVASIGQVHKATLKENGQVVAVKLLVPGIEDKFRSDIHTLKDFCSIAMPQHVTAFEEMEKQFVTEFDYVLEAENLSEIYTKLMPRWKDSIRIPKPFKSLCSKHVLTMEYLEGIKLVDGVRAKFAKVATLTGKSLEEIEEERKSLIKQGLYQFKSIDQARSERRQIEWMLLFKDLTSISNISKLVYNYSPLRLATGPFAIQWSEPPLDLGSILELLCKVHANELFEHGVFNGDPHPGNILLCSDGKVGLIDYGQVKRMNLENRITYAKLIIAHAKGDKSEIIRLHFNEIGTKTKYQKEDIGYLMSCFYHDRDTEDVMQGMTLSSFIDWLQAQDPMVKLPEDFIFASRLSIMLRGMGNAFGLKLRMSRLWEEEARNFLKSQKIDYE